MISLLQKVVLPSLVSAGDFAYIEEAAGTYEMLKLIERVLRYSLQENEMDILENEILVMTAILELYRYRFGSFQFQIHYEAHHTSFEIKRYQLINELIQSLEAIMEKVHTYSQLTLKIVYNDALEDFQLIREV